MYISKIIRLCTYYTEEERRRRENKEERRVPDCLVIVWFFQNLQYLKKQF